MKGLGIEAKITFKHIYTMIVLGNKIDDTNYISLHFLITVVGFSLYKSYYIISEQKTKYIDVHRPLSCKVVIKFAYIPFRFVQ
jgi:exosortase/archaeosortase